jgi:glyoxylase-like metal-dependent hydrolase (beta-lactamase superfamily II)
MPDLKAAIVPVTPFQQNCAIVWDEATMRGVVVDPGGDVERIREAIAGQGVKVERILLTHGHIDHAGGAAALREGLSAEGAPVPIEGPDERDRFLLDGLERQGQAYGIAGVRNVLPDRWLAQGDAVDIGGHTFQVLHCPGHTPGHLVFFSEAQRFALVGDVLFKGSVGRSDFPRGDQQQLIRSITTRLWPMGDQTAFVPGHGPMSTFGHERATNPFVADRVLAA